MSSTQVTTAPYGSWKSPISASSVAKASTNIESVLVDPITHGSEASRVYWLESRPSEDGRSALLSKLVDDYSDRTLVEHLPDTKWNVRSAVHEYGGGEFAVYDGLVVFTNWSDMGLYLLDTASGKEPVRFGEQDEDLMYAAFEIHPSKKFVVAVREDHRESDIEALATLVAIPLPTDNQGDTQDIVLFEGTDFVSTPTLNSKRNEIAFFVWNHPNMNWDATTLYLARLQLDPSTGLPTPGLADINVIAGSPDKPKESIYQPRFDQYGVLHFFSDRNNGFWNPYYADPANNHAVTLSLAKPMPAEFCEPEWTFGESSFQPIHGREFCMVVTYKLDGIRRLGILNVATHVIEDLPVPGWTMLYYLRMAKSGSGEPVLVLIAGGPEEPYSLYTYFINGLSATKFTQGDKVAVKESSAGYISVPQTITFPTKLPPFNDTNQETVDCHMYYYPPVNKDFKAPEGTLPPLIVQSHGGPTACSYSTYQATLQYWTTRGFAVADVNYGGSTGYGRQYRERLYKNWGEVDVQDCCAAALYLADTAKVVNRQKLIVMGDSAGGYTTLACLAFRPEVFAVGASLYGICDLEVDAQDTHKFESRYSDQLIGPLPEARDIYIKRSPLYSVDTLSCPAIFLQGLEDNVVLPKQTTLMVDALKKKGVPVSYVEFEGEQHGFGMEKNIIRSFEARVYFFGKILGFEPADAIDPVPIYK